MSVTSNPSVTGVTLGDIKADGTVPFVSDVTINTGNLVFDSGKGIDFSATADAGGMTGELFADYEKGTWTPTIQDNSGSDSEGQAYTTQVGRYFRMGDLVFIAFRVTISDLGTLTVGQGARLAGLPFTSIGIYHGAIAIGLGDSLALPNASETVTGFVQASNTFIALKNWDATTGVSDLLISELSVGGDLLGVGFYEV